MLGQPGQVEFLYQSTANLQDLARNTAKFCLITDLIKAQSSANLKEKSATIGLFIESAKRKFSCERKTVS